MKTRLFLLLLGLIAAAGACSAEAPSPAEPTPPRGSHLYGEDLVVPADTGELRSPLMGSGAN